MYVIVTLYVCHMIFHCNIYFIVMLHNMYFPGTSMTSSCQINTAFKTTLGLSGKVFIDYRHTHTTGRNYVHLVEPGEGAL